MEYYNIETSINTDREYGAIVSFSAKFHDALEQETGFKNWTPQDPFPAFSETSAIPAVMLTYMSFRGYKYDIDLTKWDVSFVSFYDWMFHKNLSKRIDLSTWDVDSSVKSISSKSAFECPSLEVLDISSLTNHEVLTEWFRKADLPKLQHLFVHDSSMADDVWEILRDAYLNCANTRRQEAGQRGDWEAMRFFAGLMDGDYRFSEITNRIRNEYSPKIKIHIV